MSILLAGQRPEYWDSCLRTVHTFRDFSSLEVALRSKMLPWDESSNTIGVKVERSLPLCGQMRVWKVWAQAWCVAEVTGKIKIKSVTCF